MKNALTRAAGRRVMTLAGSFHPKVAAPSAPRKGRFGGRCIFYASNTTIAPAVSSVCVSERWIVFT
jgi:hypothetical protein